MSAFADPDAEPGRPRPDRPRAERALRAARVQPHQGRHPHRVPAHPHRYVFTITIRAVSPNLIIYYVPKGDQGTVFWPGEAHGLPLRFRLLPEYLRDLGYATHMVGKWHLVLLW